MSNNTLGTVTDPRTARMQSTSMTPKDALVWVVRPCVSLIDRALRPSNTSIRICVTCLYCLRSDLSCRHRTECPVWSSHQSHSSSVSSDRNSPELRHGKTYKRTLLSQKRSQYLQKYRHRSGGKPND
jgi:hypothetical protein